MERIGALPKDIKQKNDSEILRSLADLEVFTVQDIANRTKISRLTITRALERFMEKGIVVQSGKGSSTSLGGKKPQEYTLNHGRYAITIAPSKGKTLCSLMSFDGKELDSEEFSLSGITYPQFIDASIRCIRSLLEKNDIDPDSFYGILLCSGGIIDGKEGNIRISSIPQWGKDLNVVADIRNRLGSDVRILIENVSRVCSSMLRFNNEIQGKRAALMYADLGVSITLMEDGRLYDTSNNLNGEMGHMCLEPSDEEVCVCGARGCFEVLISQKRIRSLLSKMPAQKRKELLADLDDQDDIRIHILEKEKQGDRDFEEIIDHLAKYIGLAFRNVCLTVDPDMFIMQGVFSHASDRFFDKVKKVMRENKYLEDINIDIRKENRELSDMLKKGGMNIILSNVLED